MSHNWFVHADSIFCLWWMFLVFVIWPDALHQIMQKNIFFLVPNPSIHGSEIQSWAPWRRPSCFQPIAELGVFSHSTVCLLVKAENLHNNCKYYFCVLDCRQLWQMRTLHCRHSLLTAAGRARNWSCWLQDKLKETNNRTKRVVDEAFL